MESAVVNRTLDVSSLFGGLLKGGIGGASTFRLSNDVRFEPSSNIDPKFG